MSDEWRRELGCNISGAMLHMLHEALGRPVGERGDNCGARGGSWVGISLGVGVVCLSPLWRSACSVLSGLEKWPGPILSHLLYDYQFQNGNRWVAEGHGKVIGSWVLGRERDLSFGCRGERHGDRTEAAGSR